MSLGHVYTALVGVMRFTTTGRGVGNGQEASGEWTCQPRTEAAEQASIWLPRQHPPEIQVSFSALDLVDEQAVSRGASGNNLAGRRINASNGPSSHRAEQKRSNARSSEPWRRQNSSERSNGRILPRLGGPLHYTLQWQGTSTTAFSRSWWSLLDVIRCCPLHRVAEINRKKELDAKLRAKEQQILLAHKIERELKLGGWLKTAAHPPVLWLPKLHSEDTQLLLEQRQTDLDAWKVLAL